MSSFIIEGGNPIAGSITPIGNKNAVTDGASAAVMARAAVQCAGMNVKINATGLQDQALAAEWQAEVSALEAEVAAIATAVMATAAERGGFA